MGDIKVATFIIYMQTVANTSNSALVAHTDTHKSNAAKIHHTQLTQQQQITEQLWITRHSCEIPEVHIIQTIREEESAAATHSADSSRSAVTCSPLPTQTMKPRSISEVQHYAWA